MKPGKSLLCLLPLLLLLTGAAGWLRQWPIATIDKKAKAYRVELGEAVYRHARDIALRDVAVIDADGRPVPAMLFAADAPTAQAPGQQPLRWFALPKAPAATLDMMSERDESGQLLRIRTREVRRADADGDSWLVDMSPLPVKPEALLLQFAPEAQFSASMRVEGSDDLKSWAILHDKIAVLQLQQGDARMVQTRIALAGQARYLRLTLQGAEAVLQAVLAELPAAHVEPERAWQRYQSKPDQERLSFEFEVDGRQPFDRVDVILPGSALARFRLESRDSPQQPWQHRAGPWMQYQLGEEARSAAQQFAPLRQRYWRLIADRPLHDMPQLQLGWRPEVLIFVATGKPPYRLVAGSATQQRQDAPVADVLAQMRGNYGTQWRPAMAEVSGEGEIADSNALTVARDNKPLLLWVILIVAVLLIGGFAVSLLKAQRTDEHA
ncbi:MAG: DUF3999 family protein [Pseudomonadota bacterium]|nr:DUF3999 family protein [Pseudomonadota bacterium]